MPRAHGSCTGGDTLAHPVLEDKLTHLEVEEFKDGCQGPSDSGLPDS